MNFSVFVPLGVALVLSLLAIKGTNYDPSAHVYRYPKSFSLVMMVVGVVMLTAPLWPGAGLDKFQAIGIDSFFFLFFLIGFALEKFRIVIDDEGIKQGFWPVRNEIPFSKMATIELSKQVRNTYALVIMSNGKKFKFEGSIANFEGFCERLRQEGAARKISVASR
jgi:hypothetical protein